MTNRTALAVMFLMCAATLGACRQHEAPALAGDPAALPSPPPSMQSWLGQWNGPEGTFLRLAADGSAYKVTIANLDGPADYAGHQVGDHIEFERNGATESIRATDGQATGMKWLADKKDCLTVKPGEGYCRD
jgi:hypothetical protein